MPGRNPAEAVTEYIEPLQQSLSCFTKSVLRPSGYEPDIIQTVTFPKTRVELLTLDEEILWLSFAQTFSIGKPLWLGSYKITTRSYMYAVENNGRQEIVAFHWHPDSDITIPHLHIGYGAGYQIRAAVRNAHFATGRVAIEEFCQMLIKDFEVIPERDDADKILADNLAKFQTHKTWH